jgi:molybdopterin molybdotransferase
LVIHDKFILVLRLKISHLNSFKAINLKAEQINIPGGTTFKITDRIPAGSTGNTLASGCAARLFTGAPIPKGANTVVMQEECELIENASRIEIYRPIALNENIRPMGNDIQSGDVILSKGKQLQPQDIALAASVGVGKLEVFNKIKVGVFFTGNELIEPGKSLQPTETPPVVMIKLQLDFSFSSA